MANYIGMNYNLDGVAFDCLDGTTIMAFKGDVVQFFTNEVLTSTASRIAMFPEVGTSQITYVYRGGQSSVPGQFYQIWFFNNAGDYWRYEVATPHQNPTTYTFLQTGSHSWKVNRGPAGANDDLLFKNDNGVMKVDQLGNTGNFQPYGPGNTLYPTLPNTQIPDACWNNTLDGYVYVSIVDTIYKLDAVTATMVSFKKYNVAPPVIPPTPLPDIEIIYSAPSQFNLFSTDVSLVSETQYGWKFNKTLNDANKMELYLYHSSAPGAIPFNYNDLLQLTINMKNNLVLPAGEIFLNVYTGPPTAPNWYYYKDTYNFSPALGTTLDTDLVQHILNLTDPRSDPIIAISLHSNSAQQQINCDVSDVSFTILIPSINSTQKVIVKLQNNFIVLDDKYWDLSQTAEGYNNTSLLQGFSISSWNPNIIGGNYPQSGTAKEGPDGAALYLAGTWQYWETLDGNTWTATPNSTVTWGPQVTSVVAPSIQSNGYAYIGTQGLTDNRDPIGFPTSYGPLIWNISNTNQLSVQWVGYRPTSYTPLGLMTTPNNFTAAQAASGLFDSLGVVGGTDIGVWISTETAPNGDPVADRDVVYNVLSEVQLTIKRSWELNTTTYSQSLTSGREVTGQYVDPAYTTSAAPNNFVMPSNWVVEADNSFQFEILFSGGLGNRLPAETSATYTMTVTPTPSVAVTFIWTANYYTESNVLIGAVAGFTPTGLVSSFTTGASLKPANAAYILYGCTSSENIDAYVSLVFIEPVAPEPFTLVFNGGLKNQVITDGTYFISPTPLDQLAGYAWTATFADVNNASLGTVPGHTLSGQTSQFAIVYANLPAGAVYVNYNCLASGGGQAGNTAQLSITIVPEEVGAEFDLLFNRGLINTMSSDGTYTVNVSPVAVGVTYSFTGKFYDVNNGFLGDLVFTPQPDFFTYSFTFASMPSGARYISFVGTSSEGIVSQLSITICEPQPPEPPPPTILTIKTEEAIINKINYHINESHKIIDSDVVSELVITLTDNDGNVKYCTDNIFYEIEIKESDANP